MNTQPVSSALLRPRGLGLLLLGLVAGAPSVSVAQTDVELLGRVLSGARPPQAYYDLIAQRPDAFQFSERNGWVVRGKRVAEERRAARAAAVSGLESVSQADIVGGIMRGDLHVPAFLALYANTDSATTVAMLPHAIMEERLYGTAAAPPYSVHTYYRELSNDSLRVNGTVLAWTRVDSADTWYEGAANGLDSSGDIPGLIRELVQAHDDALDYGQFDNDGPDGVPNSGDDDGVVDAIVILHPEVDGACKNVVSAAANNIWAHRFSYAGWTGFRLQTQDPSNAPGATFISVNDYIIQGGQGGDIGCTPDEPVAMGIVGHETGHLLGLPDLYDTRTFATTEGIGYWGLMGSGNWNEPFSPAHMSAWSKAELGWITEVLVDQNASLDIGPVVTSDTAFVVPLAGSSEYFLLENRQAVGSDAEISGAGLVVWHIDPAVIDTMRPTNRINTTFPQGVVVEQADGNNDLANGVNRGDAGDPFPGSSNRTVFGSSTSPSTVRNDGTPTFLVIDSIGMISGGLRMKARVRFPGRIAASDTAATFRLDGQSYQVFNGSFEPGSSHTLDIDSVQDGNAGRSRFMWLSWSNGEARTHTFTATGSDTITANVGAEHRLKADVQGPGGAVTAAPTVDVGGTFFATGTVVTVTADITAGGHVFEGWSGDTTASSPTLQLTMHRPYDVTASFAAPLAITDPQPVEGVMGAQYAFQFDATGGLTTRTWSLVNGTLPASLQLLSDGRIAGRPEETGTFPITVRVTSGSQSQTVGTQLVVAAPVLAMDDVVAHVTNARVTLSADEVRYMDLVGNRNGKSDIGDFLAWVETTGGAVSAAMMRRVLAEAEEGAR